MSNNRQYVHHVIEGTLFYPMVLKPSVAAGKFASAYSVGVEMTAEGLKKLKEQGLSPMATLKTDAATGKTFVKFSRPIVTKKGEPLDPPIVIDKEGKAVTTAIANGSTGRVRVVAVGQGTEGTLRLDALQVIEHIPYESGREAAVAKSFGVTLDTSVADTTTTTKTSTDDFV